MDFCKSLDIMQQQYQQQFQTFLEDDRNSNTSSLDEENDLIINDDFEEIIYGDGNEKRQGTEGANNINNAHKQCKSSKLDHVKRIIDNSGRKRRIYSTIHNDPKQSTRRFRANDRERRRMNSLNGALQALKGCVPSYHGKKRLTKLQILKFACHYISDLSDLLCSTTTSPDVLCENNNRRNTTNYQQHQHQLPQHHQQQQQISPAIPPPTTTAAATPDCDTSYSSVDSFMSIMADQQQQQQQQQPRQVTNQADFE